MGGAASSLPVCVAVAIAGSKGNEDVAPPGGAKSCAKHSKQLSRRLDGSRSATRKEQEGGTCATRVTRGTIDFQEGDGFELRAGKAL